MLISSERVFAGFVLAGLVAVPLGVVMAVWWPAKAIVDPFISLLRPLPSITWIPLTILWLGIGEQQKVAIVFLGSWIYILFYTLAAVQRVDPLLIRAARNLGAGDTAVMWQVILPAALPGIIAGLKITLAISWSCVLSAELVAAQSGLGALIWQGKDWGNLPLVLVGMVAISITVLIADMIAEPDRAPAAALGAASPHLMPPILQRGTRDPHRSRLAAARTWWRCTTSRSTSRPASWSACSVRPAAARPRC